MIKEENKFDFDVLWSPESVMSYKIDPGTWERGSKQYMRVIENILTHKECQQLIELAERKGYEAALVNIGGGRQKLMSDVRNNDRCIIDDPETMEVIWQRILSVCQDRELLHGPYRDQTAFAVGLNERMRILRYDPGTYFAPHFDGSYRRGLEAGLERRGEASYITAQFYLNEGFQGGATRFMNCRNESIGFDLIPKTGSILLFQHDMYHEGSLLVEGRKYALRTDVMYTNKGPGHEYSVQPIILSSSSSSATSSGVSSSNNNKSNKSDNPDIGDSDDEDLR